MELQSVEIQGRLARNARFEAPTIWSRFFGLLVARRAYGGKLHNFSVSKVVMSLCAASMSHMSEKCRKSFSGTGANTFARFSENGLHVSWQAQHFGDLHRHFAWQAHHCRRVTLRFFWRIALSGPYQVVLTCKFRGRCGLLRYVMKLDGSLARNIEF